MVAKVDNNKKREDNLCLNCYRSILGPERINSVK